MKVRIDKWLWSIRLYKSRTLATDACKAGKVKINGESVKASYLLGEGEIVVVKKDGFNFQYKALQLIEKRVGAPIAAACYEDMTPVEEKNKYDEWFSGGAIPMVEKRERGTGRPTKKERRDIDRLKEE
jgi:ribosome-associated heat shock protein Hsp15